MPLTPQITLSITLDDFQGNQVGSATLPAYIQIALCNFGSFLPRIAGTAMVAQVGPILIPYLGVALTGIKLWGNDVIIPANTAYNIAILDAKKNLIQSNTYVFNGTINADLSTLTPTFPSNGPTVLGGSIAIAFSATPQFNCAQLHAPVMFDMTLTGTVTSSTCIGSYPGQIVTFLIAQDGIGSHTFAWPVNVKNHGIIDPAASSVTVQSFVARADGNLYPIGPQTYS